MLDSIESLYYQFFPIISSPFIEVVVKETPLTNIVESVQIFEHLNKLPSKSPLYEANEFHVLEPLLLALVSGIIFVAFFVRFLFYLCVNGNVVTRTILHIPGGVGQGTCRVRA